jgi:predicted RNA-binding protein YlqC (UPF0109 family)
MEKLLKWLVSAIVQKPKAVKITADSQSNHHQLTLEVDPEDIKIVIGKKGRTIKALRNLLRLRALQEGSRVDLNLQEESA